MVTMCNPHRPKTGDSAYLTYQGFYLIKIIKTQIILDFKKGHHVSPIRPKKQMTMLTLLSCQNRNHIKSKPPKKLVTMLTSVTRCACITPTLLELVTA